MVGMFLLKIYHSQTLSDGGTSGGDCKEAQDLSRTIDKLESYADNPMPSTVLVICYKQ
jgi:hypothetical protein